jgi:sensor histidine kinase YesM
MNPHFIFNCLSAIDNLIQTSQPDKAGSWLSRFAHLIRSVLDGSKNNLVPFQKDFETMKLYLELEQFRCNYKFSYQLDADQELLNGDFKVPPLIVQPFLENAIHHGLLNKPDQNRNLDVKIQLKEEHIVYSVTDNGVGRQLAGMIKERNRPEHQSYGIAITRERIQLHNSHKVSEQDVIITDMVNDGRVSGTKAVVRISSLEN